MLFSLVLLPGKVTYFGSDFFFKYFLTGKHLKRVEFYNKFSFLHARKKPPFSFPTIKMVFKLFRVYLASVVLSSSHLRNV